MNAASHLKYMLLGGAGVLVLLLLVGMPLQNALVLSIALGCLLMHVFMMGGGHSHDAAPHAKRHAPGEANAHDPGSTEARSHTH